MSNYIKVIDDNIAFYYRNEILNNPYFKECLKKEPKSYFIKLSSCDFAVDISKNTLLKSFYSIETMLDKLLNPDNSITETTFNLIIGD